MDDKLRQRHQGHLIKFTNVVKGWQSRWFLLDPESGTLQYYLSEGDKYDKTARGGMYLAGAVISPSFEDSHTFTVSPADGECYKLRAQNTKDRQMWINRLRIIAEMHTKIIVQHLPCITPRESRRDTLPAPRLEGLAVIDAFTQVAEIMHETQRQHSALAQSIEELPCYGTGIKSLDPNMLLIKATSQATLSCLDECMCALRSSHSSVHMIVTQSSSHQSSHLLPSKPRTAPQSPTRSALASGVTTSFSGDSNGASNLSSSHNNLTKDNFNVRHRFKMPYSDSQHSSENSQNGDSLSSTPSKSAHNRLHEHMVTGSGSELSDDDDPFGVSNGEPVEEGQRSVLMHIISQLRLGMDLTRVTLPTFILEKRSLLEMFADFLGHPDLFLKISEAVTSEERMIGVLRWYLTSIHVGRQGSIAKKPYNPIIGENFFCSWKVPANVLKIDTDHDSYTIKYRSEQVSHHPPVSAFFFECPELQMCINAHIWTKSKFMGMSVGVNLIGNIHLILGHVSETYHLTMPSAYARSVLMEPWVELGGRVHIHCPQTNYSAPIIFHTKPFYGGKLHKVTSEVKNESGIVICKVQGEWDSHLEFSYEDGTVETINLWNLEVGYRKRVRPIDRQASNESRNLWYDVTKALSLGDLITATNHKKALEDRQRAEEQRRLASKEKFPTKLFSSPATDQWIFNELPSYAVNAIPIGQANVSPS